MSFYQNKFFRVGAVILTLTLAAAGYYGFKKMTSIYKTDFGNGVVIYADDYVKSGLWVFDCEYSRLISRNPLPAPISELEDTGKLTIGDMHSLAAADKEQAKAAIRAITQIEGWYKNLRYLYSGLDEYSNLNSHVFDLVASHKGQTWALKVRQRLGQQGASSFKITIEPYNPESYVDYSKALQIAAKSCPTPQ